MKFIYRGNANKSGIYKITNKINGRIYIGSAKLFKVRWLQHKSSLIKNKHQNKFLQNDFNKCFEEIRDDNFLLFEVLEITEGTTKQRRLIEQKYIRKYFDGQKDCYNFVKTTIKKQGPWSKTPEETRRKISKTRLEKIKSGQIIPTKHTEKHKQKLRKNNPGGKATSKAILQICPVTGNVINKWLSTRQAGLSLGIKSWHNISLSANKNPTQTVGGYFWRWIGSKDIHNKKLSNIQNLNEKRKDLSWRNAKKVQQFSKDGNLIATWNSFSSAANSINGWYYAIGNAIKNGKQYKGFIWKML